MPSSRGQYALESLFIMGAMMLVLGLLATHGTALVLRMQEMEAQYFEQQFLGQLDQACSLLSVMGSGSELNVKGFLPKKTTIQMDGNYLIMGDQNTYCPHSNQRDETTLQGTVQFTLHHI